jgi:predicted RNA-binding Zn-ribbon protein involved in translation (DUF1610 family)
VATRAVCLDLSCRTRLIPLGNVRISVTRTALQRESHAGTSQRKTTLFCPQCGHESPADGDWAVSEADGHDAYVCPECGATIAERPSH